MSGHDRLMAAFQLYFKANQRWESTQTHVSAIALRQALSELRHRASEYRVEIQAVREEKPRVKSPKWRAEQAAQNEKAQGKDDAN
jgi:uncharacterized membrane protein